MDALQEAREYLERGERTEDDTRAIACYLAGINAALIAIAERLPEHEPQQHEPPRSSDASEIFSHLPTELQEAITNRPPSYDEIQAAKDNALPAQHDYGSSKLFYEEGGPCKTSD